ncbi:Protein of unknown function [Propionibacterium freudenreichii]|nr:Protein of unknown function [Propionibacterium freudenreichii]CEI22161.1 Protein of unknown function [Propionibacterium freudenreichii]
MSFSCTR